MIRETENLGDTRTQEECPRTSVKDVLQSRPHMTSSLRETTMKHCQVPDKVPPPSPGTMTTLQSPQLCSKSVHFLLQQQPVCSSASGPSSCESFSPSINGLHSTPRHRLTPLHQSVGSSGNNSLFTLGSPRNNNANHKSQAPVSVILSSTSPKIKFKDVKRHSMPSHIRNNSTAKSKESFSYSGSKNVKKQRHKSHKQIRDKRLRSSESPVSFSRSSQKRHREYELCDAGAKKLCSENQQTVTPKLSPGISSSSSSVASPEHHPKFSSRTTGNQLRKEPLCDLNPSPKYKSTESSCSSALPNSCTIQQPAVGVLQAVIRLTPNKCISLLEIGPNSDNGCMAELNSPETDHSGKANTSFSIKNSQKDTGSAQQLESSRSHSSGPQHNASVSAKNSGRGNVVGETRCNSAKTASKQKTSVSSRRSSGPPDDIGDLFTPDPLTYVAIPPTPKSNGTINKSSSTVARPVTSPKPVSISNNKVTGNLKIRKESPGTGSRQKASPLIPQSSSSCVGLGLDSLKQMHVENTVEQESTEIVYSTEKQMSNLDVTTCTAESDTILEASPAHCSQTPPQENQADRESNEYPLDVELNRDLQFALGLDLSQSSNSSEEEVLLSLDEMMNCAAKPLDTQEKENSSEPSAHGHPSQSKTVSSSGQMCHSPLLGKKPCLDVPQQPLPSVTQPGIYKNNLDQMLQEKKSTERAKEIEEQLLTECKEGLLKIAECEKPEEINTEQQEFLQHYSLTCNAFRDVPPGEKVFNLDRFGRIFNQETLQLKTCIGHLKEWTQRALLISSPAQLKMHVCVGMFQDVFNSHLPCPSQVSQFLFKLMSVHNERMVSEKALKALCDIACTAAYQIGRNGRQNFEVWMPTLADIALALMNMGAAFVVLFPLENLQPSFTERDLLEENIITTESSVDGDQASFPEYNYDNILKYLSYCMTLCPRAYSDEELLLLLTVVNTVSLDTQLILHPSVDLYPLQYKILYNIRDWRAMLPRICLALTNLTGDHHNMCLIVQLLPHTVRRKNEVLQLRQHLSLSMISKLLKGHCTYRPVAGEFKLSELRPYLPLMRPSLLLRQLQNSSSRTQKDPATLDQEAYYLCYSLLTLANEATNSQLIFSANQKMEVQLLCSELDTHVKCNIRESGKCLYRSKVKDLVARMYTKWQILLQRTKPLDGKLYDYWKPLPGDIHNSQEEQEVDGSDNGEGPVSVEGNEEESSSSEEKDVYSEDDNYEEKDAMSDSQETEDDTKSDKADGAADLKGWTAGQDSPAQMSAEEADRDFPLPYS
ncbi:SMC5-SMC6 complex localization factor protein 2 isoform X1 [Takifugu rubripes]|uniref:SMC5-SMC6 complex localization factor protein 2 isoform X1 n=1 Tax=Takifugu rubripes TaxID=31033 RepID=UPI0011452BCF|nr:SMC5-SMC6 complex localization factor protein 2-like isoform X1 [Takifugu rubripes]